MPREQIGERRFIELYCCTALTFAVLAAARIVYIEACATPLHGSVIHLLLAGPAFVIGAYYTFWRFSLLPATLFNGFGLAGLAFTGNVLSSVLMMYSARRFPLMDAPLAAADRFIGFDWVATLHLFDRHPEVNAVLRVAYDSIMPQILLIVVLLALTEQAERLYRFLMATNLALVVTCAIAVFFPALGAYEFYGISPADHPHIAVATGSEMTAPILWLRAAEFMPPMPPFRVGLISFPSFHAATAVIYIWAIWRTPVMRWIWLALNGLMLIATPVHGSHYLVDVFAGVAAAWIAIMMSGWVLDVGRRRAAAALPALARRELATR